jgi:signal transduction histidine kinase
MSEIDLKNKNVLVVEDSATQALLLQETLTHHQLTVRIAKDGLEGLKQVQDSMPDLILSDIEMPRMNGYEFCKKIKAENNYKKIPVILLTNLADPLDVINGIDCGADSFLTKPYESSLLLSTMENALKNISLRNNFSNETLTFFFEGKEHALRINQVQITELLLSTYSSAIQKNLELDKAYANLNRMNKELEENNKKLKELNEQKNQLLGMAAHDLKNHLSVIYGFSNFLLSTSEARTGHEEKNWQMIKRMHDSSTFMLHVIDDFLDFSTIESGTLTLHLSEVDLPELIQNDLLFFESLAHKKKITLAFNYKKPIPKVSCDPNKISQILNNLISNGIKFSHPEGVLEVALIPSPHEITISVKDSGTGMSPEMIKGLFQPFNKMKSTGTAGEKGTGLGLAIVQKIVLAHKGKIWVESKLGKGSTFFVSIPLSQNPSQAKGVTKGVRLDI